MSSYGSRSTTTGLVLLLLGEKESGKSSAGNAILSRRAFHKKTTQSCRRSAAIFGLQVDVVDTPGWLSHSSTPHWVSKELLRAVTLCHQGPDAILLVLPISSRLGQEEWAAMEAQLRLLETPIWQRAVILFTHGDRLGALPIQEYVRRQGGTLQWLLERCQNRYQVLSSLCSTAQLQVRQLIKKVQMIPEASRTIREIYYRVNIQLGDLSLGGTRSLQEPEMMGKEYDGAEPRQTGFIAASGPALSLILLGRRKSGKSSAGNMILGREEFLTDIQTVCCSAGHADVSGRSVTVVDTPGWSLFAQADPEEVQSEILKSPSLCAAGSKVMVLLAIPVDSFREKDRKAAETYVRLLGERIWSSTVVLFTYGDALWRKTMQDHIKEKGPPLEWILDKCEHRFHVCDTNSTDPDQVTQLLQMVESA